MKITLTILTLALLCACSENQQDASPTKSISTAIHQPALEETTNDNQVDTLESENFQIAFFDFHKGALTRLFIVIPENRVNDYELISEIVCDIENHYEVYDHTSLSFFSDMKYAGYKDDLFINESHPLEMAEYDKWMDSYYMAEFQYGSRDYQTYPVTQNMDKRKRGRIKACP